MSDDLVAFLRARLDEDEAAAKLAAREGGTWTQDDPQRYPGSISSLGGQVVYAEGAPDENQAPHIARHDPARVLREVEAKRAILDEYLAAPGWPQDVVLLAAVYSDHPDYRDEWKPDTVAHVGAPKRCWCHRTHYPG